MNKSIYLLIFFSCSIMGMGPEGLREEIEAELIEDEEEERIETERLAKQQQIKAEAHQMMANSPNEHLILIKANRDDYKIAAPQDILKLLGIESNEDRIAINTTQECLKKLIAILVTLLPFKQEQEKRENQWNVFTSKNRSQFIMQKDGNFVIKNIQKIVRNALKEFDIQRTETFIQQLFASGIRLKPTFYNATIRVLVEKILKQNPSLSLSQLSQFTAHMPDAGMKAQMARYYFFLKIQSRNRNLTYNDLDQIDELDIADYITLYGMPPLKKQDFVYVIHPNPLPRKTKQEKRQGIITPLITLNLSNKGITSLNGIDQIQDVKKVQYINLATNGIISISPYALSMTPDIVALSLENNLIQSIEPICFNGNRYLEYLNLGNNALSTLPANTFTNLGTLRYLDLSNNCFTTFPIGIFRNLAALEKLRLANNNLTDLPPSIFTGLDNIKTLELDGNEITRFPLEVDMNTPRGLRNIKTLSMQNNRLTNLGPISLLVQLQHLNLAHNQITILPQLKAAQLEYLNVGFNKISFINGDTLSKLDQLKDLLLNNNLITRFEDPLFTNLKKLEVLHLDNNGLTQLSTTLFNPLTQLESLSITINPHIAARPATLMRSFLSLLVNTAITEFRNKYFPNNTKIVIHNIPYESGESKAIPEKVNTKCPPAARPSSRAAAD